METKAQMYNQLNLGSNYPPAQQQASYPVASDHQHTVAPQYPQQSGPAGGCGRNCPQFFSVGAAAMIFVTGGMSLAWDLFSASTYTSQDFWTEKYTGLCWFVMAIVGAFCSAALTKMIQKKILMCISAFLALIGGILCVSLYDSYGGLLAARHINGFAVGWIFVPVLVMAGEESVKEWRGLLTSSIEAWCFSLGILLQTIYSTLWTYDLNIDIDLNQMHGTLIILLSAASLIITFFLVIESPVYFLVRNQEQAAVESSRRLQRPSVRTSQTDAQFDELKRYVAENRMNALGQQFVESLPALLKLCIFRGMVSMSVSLFVIFAFRVSSFRSENSEEIKQFTFIMFFVCRVIGVFVGVCMIDHLGRKPPIFGMLIAGGMAIGVGVIFSDERNFDEKSKLVTAAVLLCVYQVFASMSIPSSSTYLTEAFPLILKPFWIALAFCVEMLVHIICIAIDINEFTCSTYFYGLGVLSILFVVFAFVCLPETKRLTLRETQAKFKGILSIGFK